MKQLTLLIKPASSLCNMRCRYCFYLDEADNRAQSSMGLMDEDTTGALLRSAMDYIGEGGALHVMFQGGEPTLAGAEYFRRFGQLARQMLPRGASIDYALQTNGYQLSPELLAVLKEYRYLVGISLDGCRALHDSQRLDAAGSGTWQRVLGNLRRMQQAGIEVNALCVITGQAAGSAQRIYRTLKQLGFRCQQYIPCLDPLEVPRGSMPFSLTPEAYGRFLSEAFELWYAGWRSGDYVSVRTFEDLALNAMGRSCTSCANAGQCGQYLVVEADGSVYPCDFYALDQWRLGDIRRDFVETLLGSTAARRFAARRETPPPECGDCPYRSLCRTGCVRDWTQIQGVNHNYYCASFRMLLEQAAPRLRSFADAQLLAEKQKKKC